MSTPGFALFETPIGVCALCWGEHAVRGSQLPEASVHDTRQRMRDRFPDTPEIEPPDTAASAIADIVAVLRGQPADLGGIALDWTGVSGFPRRVYQITRSIPPGETSHYGDIARKLN